jgi:hypothetical protein
MGKDPLQRVRGVHPDPIQRDQWPEHRKRRRTRRTPEAAIQHMHNGAARQPIVEVAKDDEQCVTQGVEVFEDPRHLKLPLADAKAKVRRQHVHQCAADVDGSCECATRLAPLDRQVEPRHVDDRMACQQRVAEALRRVLPRRPERALVAIDGRQKRRRPRLDGDAGRIRELLQRDDVRVEFVDDRRHAIRIVAAVGAHAGMHVVRGDAKAARAH